MVRDLFGSVSIYIGTATADGKENYGEGESRWGYVSHREGQEKLSVTIHVSAAMFQRLVSLAERGRLPALDIDVTSTSALRTSSADGRLDAWDWNEAPHLEIAWCEFLYQFS
jgi:hypothetical protein